MQVIGTNTKKFHLYKRLKKGSVNTGSYFYAKEIEDNILPHIESDATIVTTAAGIYRPTEIPNGAVVVCHDNRTPKKSYQKLMDKGILWVCSKHSTVEKLREYGERAVYIPLSIDVGYVENFKSKKTKDTAYVGNAWSFKRKYLSELDESIVQLSGLPREDLLREMAQFKRVIAEGRCMMEAKILGCETKLPEYPDGHESVEVEIVDNKETIEYWRTVLTK